MDYSLYTQAGEATRKRKKVTDGERARKKHVDVYGSLWKTQDQSIDEYISDGQSGPESQTKADKKTE